MDWGAIGAVGEIIGATAVVASLIYVSLQLKAGTKALQTATRDSVFRSLMEWNYSVMGDPRLAWINQAGARDFESLGEEDRARYMHLMYTLLKMFENVYLHHLEGALGREVWESNLPMLSAYVTQPGGRLYWERRKSSFDSRFNRVIEALEPGPIAFGTALTGHPFPSSTSEEEETRQSE